MTKEDMDQIAEAAVISRLWKLQTTVNKLVLDGKRDPEKIVNIFQGIVSGSSEQEPSNTFIRVDRSIRPVYPNWVTEVLHPELESVGPTEYDLTRVKLWLHNDQKDGCTTTGDVIYDHLGQNGTLKTCLGLHDALAIAKLVDIKTFRKRFGKKVVFCWKSVVRDRYGRRCVPYFYGYGDQVVVPWDRLDSVWDGRSLAARFES